MKSQSRHRRIGVTCKLEKQLCFLYWKSFFIQFLQNLYETPITERDYSNAAGAPLLKSLSTVDVLVLNTPEISTFFLKEHLRKGLEATWTYFSVITLHFKIQMRIQYLFKNIFFKIVLTKCLTGYRVLPCKKSFLSF